MNYVLLSAEVIESTKQGDIIRTVVRFNQLHLHRLHRVLSFSQEEQVNPP